MHNRRQRTVVDRQCFSASVRKVLEEVSNLRGGRSAPTVDRLPRVADDPQTFAAVRQESEQHAARAVDILVLVNQHVTVLRLQLRPYRISLAQQAHRAKDQVAEIEQAFALKMILVKL